MGHDLIGLGEVMLRLAAPPPQRLDQAVALDVQIGGSEANVMAAVSRLGLRTAFISALPAEHAWGDRTVRSPQACSAGSAEMNAVRNPRRETAASTLASEPPI